MDKKGGFKECSRCGLRNKPTARQCDFCGQRFEEEDRWDQQIDALESLTKIETKTDASDDLSKRIESTIVKKDAVDRKDKPELAAAAAVATATVIRTEPSAPAPTPVEAAPSKVEAMPQPEVKVEAAPPPAAVVEPEQTVPAAVVEEVVVVEDLEPLEETVQAPVEETVSLETNESFATKPKRFFSWNFNLRSRRDVAFLLVLQGGLVVYLATVLVAGDSLETVGQWGLTILGAALMTAGLGKLTINWDIEEMPQDDLRVKEVVVEVCPRCHERVAAQDTRCPACGTEFETNEMRRAA